MFLARTFGTWEFRNVGKPLHILCNEKTAVMLGACRSVAGLDVRTNILTGDDRLRPVEEIVPLGI